MAGSRVETLTVLFTDLVGSTELRAQLGEEGADRLRYVHDALVAGAIETTGGTVVKSTGDGVMATCDSAADAVAAAVAVQQAIHDHNRRDESTRLAVRIGLSAGDVTTEDDGDCFGLPVVEAQRLEATATPGQILCSSLVRALARGRGDHRFRSMGELTLKGLPEPLLADEVLWEPLEPPGRDHAVRVPPLLQTGAAFTFAGRDREFTMLVDAWKTSREGDGQLVLLAGEPGIGKTRLVCELAAKVIDTDGLVLAGRSDEDLNAPYGPIVGALTWWAANTATPPDLGEWPQDLVRLAPDLAQATSVTEPAGDGDASLVIRALRSWLEHTAAAMPTLLVLDDLHWADAATLLVLRSLFDQAPIDKLLVVGTYRDTDLDRRHPLAATLADLRRSDHVTRLSIAGLDEEGVVAFLSAAAGYELDDAGRTLAGAVWDETAGNPFFVGEVLRHLAESGAIVERDGRWTTDLDPSDFGIPEGIREVVGRRLTRLGDDTERVLSTAAVVGLDFDIDIVAAALGIDDDDAIDALEVAAHAALVDEVSAERWRFAHAIVRETLLDELSSSRRVRQHRKVAAAIEARHPRDLDAVANQLAYHWGEAAAGGVDLESALHWATRAGDLAFEKSAIDDAIRWYENALGLLDPDAPAPTEECTLLVRLAAAKALTGGSDYHQPMLRAAALAHDLDDHELLTAALVIAGQTGYSQDPRLADPQLIAALERALTVVTSDEPALRAQLLAALALELQYLGEGDRRAALCTEAYDLAAASGDIKALFAAQSAWFFSYPLRLFDWGQAKGRVASQREIMPALIASGDAYRTTIGLHCLWYWALGLGLVDEMREVREQERDLLERRPTWMLHNTTYNQQVVDAVVRGDLDTARARVRDLTEYTASLESVSVLEYWIALEGGYAAAAIPALEEALRTAPQRRFVEAMLAAALVEGGDVERANSLFDVALDEGVDTLPDDTLLTVTAALIIEVGIALRRTDRLDDMARWVETLPDDFPVLTGVMYLGSSNRLRAGLAHLGGDHEEAERRFRIAVEGEQAIGAVPMLAATHIEWANMLLDRSDTMGAVAHARAALGVIGDLPLGRQRRRGEAILERAQASGG